jgi:HlyD family secretion protein
VVVAIEDSEFELSLGMLRDELKEIEGRLDGVDVPLPKRSEIEAAEKEREKAEIEVEMLLKEREAAQAELRYAESELQRIEGLYEKGSATARQYDTARRSFDVARARAQAVERQLEGARAAVEIAHLRRRVLDESMQDTAHLRRVYRAQTDRVEKMMNLLVQEAAVESPIDGVVLEKYVDSEKYVQPGTPLLRVGDMDTIEIRSDILSDEIARVRPGQEVVLVGPSVRNPGARGTVRKIYPSGFTKVSSLGVREQRVPVLIDFDNEELNLQPGYELDVKIVVAARDDALLAPTEAVFATADGMGAFVVEDGRARLRRLETGLVGEDHYEVTRGLEEGETVILRPPTDLEEGDRVTPSGSD